MSTIDAMSTESFVLVCALLLVVATATDRVVSFVSRRRSR